MVFAPRFCAAMDNTFIFSEEKGEQKCGRENKWMAAEPHRLVYDFFQLGRRRA